MRPAALLVTLGAVLAAGAAAWFLVSGGEGSGGDGAEGAERGGLGHEPGPVLSGRGGGVTLSPGALVDGEYDIVGRVLDENDRPLAKVSVTARRTEEPVVDGALGWERSARERRAADFDAPAQPWKDLPPDAATVSAADGSFTLHVRRHGGYSVRAEPAPPLVGTRVSWRVDRPPQRAHVRLRVLKGSALRGRVVADGEEGVPAWVRAVNEADWQSEWVPTGSGTGRFALDAVPDGPLELEVLVPGRLRLKGWTLRAPVQDEVVVRLGAGARPGARLATGIVRDLAGRSVAGARIGVTVEATVGHEGASMPADAKLLATSDELGAFLLEGPVTGRVTEVAVDAPGYLHQRDTPPTARWSGLALDPTREATLELTLWKGGVLEGRVLERGTATPLAGAVVLVRATAVDGRMTQPPVRRAISDTSGRYVVEGLAVGSAAIAVEHPTHFFAPLEDLRAASRAALRAGRRPDDAPLPSALGLFVAEEGQRVHRDLELVRGAPVRGRVVDGDGRPVEGAAVFAGTPDDETSGWMDGYAAVPFSIPGTGSPRPAAISGPDGGFTVPGLPPREEWSLYAERFPWIGERSPPFRIATGAEPPEVLLRLVKGVTVAGRVVDDRGAGVSAATVFVWNSSGQGEVAYAGTDGSHRTVSDADGVFRLEGVVPGRFVVSTEVEGRGTASETLELPLPGQVRSDVELRLRNAARPSWLRGLLVTETGAPARGKELTFTFSSEDTTMSVSANSNPRDGSFVVEMGPGKVSIGTGFTTLAEVESPASGVRVVWKEPPKRVLEGLVLDPQGRPVPLCEVTARGTAGQSDTLPAWMSDDAETVVNGWFRREVDDRGPFGILVRDARDADGRPLNLQPRTVTFPDAPSGPITVTLEPGRRVTGRVVDPGGHGVADVPVFAGGIGTRTDAAGTFVLGGLGVEAVDLEVSPPPPWARPASRRVTSGGAAVTVALTEGLSISGRVRVAPGDTLSGGGRVQGRWEAGPDVPGGALTVALERDGSFRLTGLPPGARATLRVQVWQGRGAHRYANRRVADVPAGTRDLVVDVAHGAAVSGRVEAADGTPFANGSVEVGHGQGEDAESTEVALRADGSFRLVGLPAGKVRLELERYDGGPRPEPVETEAPAADVRLALPAVVAIRGRLVGAGDDASRFRVWARRVRTGAPATARDQTGESSVARDGTFALEVLASADRWVVAARAHADERHALSPPLLAGTQDVELRLVKGATIEGTVVTSDGAPLPRPLWVRLDGNDWNAEATPDVEGRFVLNGLPPGRYTVRASTWRGGYAAVTLDDVEAGRQDVRLVLEAEAPGAGGAGKGCGGAACGGGGLACGR